MRQEAPPFGPVERIGHNSRARLYTARSGGAGRWRIQCGAIEQVSLPQYATRRALLIPLRLSCGTGRDPASDAPPRATLAQGGGAVAIPVVPWAAVGGS